MMTLIGQILGIVASTLHLIEEKQRTKFQRKYHELLTEINKLENLSDEDFNDGALDNLYNDIFLFLVAYSAILKESNAKNS